MQAKFVFYSEFNNSGLRTGPISAFGMAGAVRTAAFL
jgi:hypothetical protein